MSLDARVRVRRGDFTLDVALTVEPGEIVAVLGPNGSGKTTLLRALSGLTPLDDGHVSLAGDQIGHLPTERRNVGVVFQDHRLFPHLRVLDNVAYGPRSRSVAKSTARSSAEHWLARLGLADLAHRRPRELSGGQAQRVALARALATEPRLLLLDEPLAALDAQTRTEVQTELRTHLSAYEGPTLLVTHDPIEAILLARRIVVLEGGRIAQTGAPADIAARPATPYVAALVGVNLYAGMGSGTSVHLEGGGTLTVAEPADGPVLVALRPSAITVHLDEPGPSSARNHWQGIVRSLNPLGDRIRISVDGPPSALVDVTATAVAELGLVPGRDVWLTAKAVEVTAYPRE